MFRLIGGLIYTGEITGESDDTVFVFDERIGKVELNKVNILVREERVNKTIKRVYNHG